MDDSRRLLFLGPQKALRDATILSSLLLRNGSLAVFAVIYSELSARVTPSPQEYQAAAESTK
jgi:hypothetical protein